MPASDKPVAAATSTWWLVVQPTPRNRGAVGGDVATIPIIFLADIIVYVVSPVSSSLRWLLLSLLRMLL